MNPQAQPNQQAYNPYSGVGMPVQSMSAQPAPAPAQPIAQPAPTPVQPAPVAQSLSAAVETMPVQPQPAATPTQPTTVVQPAPAPAQPTPTPVQQPNPAIGSAQQPVGKANQNVTPDNPLSTQSTLLISELRDGLVIMKDGSFRAVIACQSINFDLMSETEREAVEYSFQNFLNSLNFTTQILIRSQRVDIGPYLERLTEIRKNNDNMLLGVLMDDYINFIDILSQEANIMDKSFFIVIPYYVSAEAEKVMTQTRNFFSSFSKSKQVEVTKIDRPTYDKAITEINNRVESVISGLFQIGIHSVRLNTRELGALYYNFNNPDTAVREPLVDFTKLATTYVKKGDKNE